MSRISVLGLIGCLLAGFGGVAETKGVRIRILTYNIHHGEGADGVLDLERIAGVIRSVDADVVCLQEVDRNLPRTEHVDIAARLAKLLEMQAVFDANYRFDGGEYGNATLTWLPVVRWENLALPGPEGAEPRGSLLLELDLGDSTLHVLNTHFGLRPEERAEQARAVVAQAAGLERAVLAGDLNATPESEPMTALLERFRDTAGSDVGPTSPSHTPRRRIDYVLATLDMKVVEGRTITGGDTAVASDHLPYLAVVEVGASKEKI